MNDLNVGSILAGFLALKNKWSINIGGGFHHCSAENAGGSFNHILSFVKDFLTFILRLIGFCLFADITLTIKYLWQEVNNSLKILIVDCDAHQGNGYAQDVIKMKKEEK